MKKKNTVKVAMIDNSIYPEIYNPVGHWQRYLDVEWASFEAKKSRFPDLKDGFTHIILTGSESSVLERDKWVYEEIEVIQEAVEKGCSILGSCYGHQLLAMALAGPSHVQRSEKPEVGWISIQIKELNNILGEKKRAYSFSSHFDEVVNLKDSFTILASSKHCQIQAFQLKNKPIWGLQIHPEIDVPSAKRFLTDLIRSGFANKDVFEEALRSNPRESDLIWQIVKTFLKA